MKNARIVVVTMIEPNVELRATGPRHTNRDDEVGIDAP
jgi:hypothetical protein